MVSVGDAVAEGKVALMVSETGGPVMEALLAVHPVPRSIKLHGLLWAVATNGAASVRGWMTQRAYVYAMADLRKAGVEPEQCVVVTPDGWRGRLALKVMRSGSKKVVMNL